MKHGVYGKKGEDGTYYIPGAREYPLALFDSSKRTAWLFGGYFSYST